MDNKKIPYKVYLAAKLILQHSKRQIINREHLVELYRDSLPGYMGKSIPKRRSTRLKHPNEGTTSGSRSSGSRSSGYLRVALKNLEVRGLIERNERYIQIADTLALKGLVIQYEDVMPIKFKKD